MIFSNPGLLIIIYEYVSIVDYETD